MSPPDAEDGASSPFRNLPPLSVLFTPPRFSCAEDGSYDVELPGMEPRRRVPKEHLVPCDDASGSDAGGGGGGGGGGEGEGEEAGGG